MTGAEAYCWLVSVGRNSMCEQFDRHVVASVLGLAIEEAAGGRSLCDATGLAPAELGELIASFFPHAQRLLGGLDPAYAPQIGEDEACLRELLSRRSTEHSRLEQLLAFVIARRAQSPNHLWQDLGLRNRRELSWLMSRHFEPLANRNVNDMKWKKFLYRVICRDEGFTICAAPSCSECTDFDGCFGDESGESRLALMRREVEYGGTQQGATHPDVVEDARHRRR